MQERNLTPTLENSQWFHVLYATQVLQERSAARVHHCPRHQVHLLPASRVPQRAPPELCPRAARVMPERATAELRERAARAMRVLPPGAVSEHPAQPVHQRAAPGSQRLQRQAYHVRNRSTSQIRLQEIEFDSRVIFNHLRWQFSCYKSHKI
jgi:hypothetical protein